MAQSDLFGFKLNLKRPLAFFDLETTGVDVVKDRIVEIGIIRVNLDGVEETLSMRINPCIPIPLESSLIHGIYDEDVVTAPKFADVAKELFDFLNPCDFAGFNSNHFDIPVLLEEFMRAGIALDIESRNLIDVFKIYVHYEKRDLAAAYKFYCGKTIEHAHSAEADIRATYEVLQGQLQRYSDLKNDMRTLHELSNKDILIDSGKRFMYQDGQPAFNFGKHKGKTVEQVFREEPSYFQWMMNGEFPAHTKQKLKEFKEAFERKKNKY